jgi:hypothetical protein
MPALRDWQQARGTEPGPLFCPAHHPASGAEAGWQVACFLVGVALFTKAGRWLEKREVTVSPG